MKTKNIMIGFVILLIVISTLLLLTHRMIRAEEAVSDSDISRKLDEILNNQKSILENLSQIKEELSVIKIRVTR